MTIPPKPSRAATTTPLVERIALWKPKSDGLNNLARMTTPSNCAITRLACETASHFVPDAAARTSEADPPSRAPGGAVK